MTTKDRSYKTTDAEEEYYSIIKRAFNTLAPFYDIVTRPISRVRDEVANFSNARNGLRILDVSTGIGQQES